MATYGIQWYVASDLIVLAVSLVLLLRCHGGVRAPRGQLRRGALTSDGCRPTGGRRRRTCPSGSGSTPRSTSRSKSASSTPGGIPTRTSGRFANVNFEIAEGQTVGILGRNGSGKSTLLKCVSGILQPTEGKVVVRGSLAALLELGAGFQPELSGRENIYLNASLLGLSTKEVDRRFDEIVAFAELEQFIDNQVKYYSSGMYVRLGFAVAVNVDPDILVIDEVLAVGDEDFSRKCMARIKEFQDDGRTIVFVTHSSDLVRQICDFAVVLNSGDMIGVGSRRRCGAHRTTSTSTQSGAGSGPLRWTGRRIRSAGGTAPLLRSPSVESRAPGDGRRSYLLPGSRSRCT